MELKQIECFVACVNHGSFSKAAEQLYMNQSNISRIIKSLEEELNTPLFLRNNKGVILTMEGERIYHKSLQVLGNLEDMASKANKPPRYFSMAAVPSKYIARTFTKFCYHHSQEGTVFRAFSYSTTQILQYLEQGTLDIGFIYSSEKQWPNLEYVLRKKKLQYTPLCDALPCLYIGAKNPLFQSEGDTIENLKEHRFVNMECDMDSYYDLHGTIQRYELERPLSHAHVIHGCYGITQTLIETDFCYLGHIWVRNNDPDQVILPDIISVYKNYRLLQSGDGAITMGYVTRIDHADDPYVKAFIDMFNKDILQK